MERVLLFSGGKDSLACLYLLREHWGNGLTILHIDTGAKLPEVSEYIAALAREIPGFMIIKSDQPSWVEKHGMPVDVLPIAYSGFGQLMSGPTTELMQPYVTCCDANIWAPMRDAIAQIAPDVIYHGSKRADKVGQKNLKGMVSGSNYEALIDDWTDDDVVGYLAGLGIELPEWFNQIDDTSMDCWTCTAFMRTSAGRIAWLKEKHAGNYEIVMRRIDGIRSAIESESAVYLRG